MLDKKIRQRTARPRYCHAFDRTARVPVSRFERASACVRACARARVHKLLSSCLQTTFLFSLSCKTRARSPISTSMRFNVKTKTHLHTRTHANAQRTHNTSGCSWAPKGRTTRGLRAEIVQVKGFRRSIHEQGHRQSPVMMRVPAYGLMFLPGYARALANFRIPACIRRQ